MCNIIDNVQCCSLTLNNNWNRHVRSSSQSNRINYRPRPPSIVFRFSGPIRGNWRNLPSFMLIPLLIVSLINRATYCRFINIIVAKTRRKEEELWCKNSGVNIIGSRLIIQQRSLCMATYQLINLPQKGAKAKTVEKKFFERVVITRKYDNGIIITSS